MAPPLPILPGFPSRAVLKVLGASAAAVGLAARNQETA